MNKTLVVDGSYLFKNSLSSKNRVMSGGRDITAVFMFMMKLRKYAKEIKPTKIVVFWDGENSGKYKYDLYEGYKSNRKNKDWYRKIELSEAEIKYFEREKESELYQKIRIQQYLEELFIRQFEQPKIEGDDLIAVYCKNYHESEKIIILTNDRDMCQLVNYDNVYIKLVKVEPPLTIDKHSFYLLFKYHYTNSTLYKILLGDNSDEIPGITGLGDETLYKYFPEFKTTTIDYQYVIDKAKSINEERVKNKKKPYKVLENIVDGVFDNKKLGIEGYERNKSIVNLLNPIVEDDTEELIEMYTQTKLDPEGRGSKNLIKLMNEDEFFKHYLNTGGFTEFVRPFFTHILVENPKK